MSNVLKTITDAGDDLLKLLNKAYKNWWLYYILGGLLLLFLYIIIFV